MKEWIGTTDVAIDVPTVVSIGKFDGEHKGHQKILKTMKEIASWEGYATAIFTFGTPPAAVVEGNLRPQIDTNEERRERLREAGIMYIVEYPFTQETASMSGEDFIRSVLIGKMNMKAIVAGPDCSFGKDRSGNAALLEKLGPVLGFRTVIIQKEKDDGRDISSTYIREELMRGDIQKANELLGSPYFVEGTVREGNHIGGPVLGFPTVNVAAPAGKLLPRSGVYETRVILSDHREIRGVTNVGGNPSVSGDRQNHVPRVETFLLDFSGNLYGQKIRIEFYRFLRPEIKFDSLESLRAQIEKDVKCLK